MKTASTALGVLLAATALCGAAPAPALPSGRTVTLSGADEGRTVSVARDDVVRVELAGVRDGDGNTWVWSAPRATDPGVLERTGGGTSPGGDAFGSFRAVGAGTSDLTSGRSCRPAPGRRCPHLVLAWRATVVVR
ncbi:hypothetical protein ACIGXM_21690 [Kitasatospora sp. NPDC052896]|uniref:hypothetical protein n=1 Tax=Kitasatospora sp. NPDC052896 TaxID=3364061 RepID=UPI0037CB52C7